jgi:AraC family transcriptional regulator
VAFINTVLNGAVVERVANGPEHTYRPLQLVFHPENEEHACRIGPAGSISFGVIIPSEQLRLISEFCELGRTPLALTGERFNSLCRHMIHEFHSEDPASDLGLQAAFFELAGEIGRFSRFQRDLRPQPWLEKAREMLHSRHAESLSLADIAKAVAIHPVHLTQEFRRFFGMPVGEYVRSIRVQEARVMLIKSERPLAAIAAHSGFYDQAHFSKVFKKQTGVTPAAFRKLFGRTAHCR